MTLQFEAGKTYATRSICDHETWMRITVKARTEKTITVDRSGKTKTLRPYVYEGVEQVKPWGTYSMCAIIGADDEGRGQ